MIKKRLYLYFSNDHHHHHHRRDVDEQPLHIHIPLNISRQTKKKVRGTFACMTG